jgi:hypothetical protein
MNVAGHIDFPVPCEIETEKASPNRICFFHGVCCGLPIYIVGRARITCEVFFEAAVFTIAREYAEYCMKHLMNENLQALFDPSRRCSRSSIADDNQARGVFDFKPRITFVSRALNFAVTSSRQYPVSTPLKKTSLKISKNFCKSWRFSGSARFHVP